MAGRQTLDLVVEVRILPPQPNHFCRLFQEILTQAIQPKSSYFNSYCPWRQRGVRGNYIVIYTLLVSGELPKRGD